MYIFYWKSRREVPGRFSKSFIIETWWLRICPFFDLGEFSLFFPNERVNFYHLWLLIQKKKMSQVASGRYYAVNWWLSVETRTVQIIKPHREHPNFILARSVNSLPELLARNKADFSFISQLPSICLRIMLIRREMTGSRGSPGWFQGSRIGFWIIKIWLNWSADIQGSSIGILNIL